jgi:hypothetical protein
MLLILLGVTIFVALRHLALEGYLRNPCKEISIIIQGEE